MNRISRILGNNTHSAARLGDRSFHAGSLALLLCATGLASLGAGCASDEQAKTITREQYAVRAEAIEQMVADGEVSREDADARLGRMRRMVARDGGDGAAQTRTVTRREYADAVERVDQMVADGELSRERADTRLEQMRSMIGRGTDEEARASATMTREEYARAAETIEQMVADGEVSREDADIRLGGMRRMLKRGEGEEAQAGATMTREEYARAAEAIEQMVADGEVSREDADTRLGEMRRMISRER